MNSLAHMDTEEDCQTPAENQFDQMDFLWCHAWFPIQPLRTYMLDDGNYIEYAWSMVSQLERVWW